MITYTFRRSAYSENERKKEGICHYYAAVEFGFLPFSSAIWASTAVESYLWTVTSSIFWRRNKLYESQLAHVWAWFGGRCYSANQPLHWACFCAGDRKAGWWKQRCRIVVDPTTKNILIVTNEFPKFTFVTPKGYLLQRYQQKIKIAWSILFNINHCKFYDTRLVLVIGLSGVKFGL